MTTVFPVQFDATFGDGLPTTDSTDPVQAIVDILDLAETYDLWTSVSGTPVPDINYVWNVRQKSRENNKDPQVYVWSPIEVTFDSFDAKFSRMDETQTVEASVWTLDPTLTAEYASDIIQFLSEYATDNSENTNYHQIRPTNENDLRAEKAPQKTDHFITNIQVELTGLRDSGI